MSNDAQIRKQLMSTGIVRPKGSRRAKPAENPTFNYNPFRKGGLYGTLAKQVFHA